MAVGRGLGIEEPQLMKIMRATLYSHNEWFKLQMCKDRFEGLLRIDSLKEVNTPFLAPVSTSKSYADSCTNGSSQATVTSGTRMSEDSSSPTQASSMDVIGDENAILKVMVGYGFLPLILFPFQLLVGYDICRSCFSCNLYLIKLYAIYL